MCTSFCKSYIYYAVETILMSSWLSFSQTDSGTVVSYMIDAYGHASLWAQVTQEPFTLGTVFTEIFNRGDEGSRV